MRHLPCFSTQVFRLSGHCPQPALSLNKDLVFKQIWTRLSSLLSRIEVRVEDIAWHILLLSLTGGERCTTTLSKKGYSRSPLFTSGVLPKLGVWVPHFGNDP